MSNLTKTIIIMTLYLCGAKSFAGVCYVNVYHLDKPGQIRKSYCTADVSNEQCVALVKRTASKLNEKDSRYYFGDFTWTSDNRLSPFASCQAFPR